MMYCCYYLSTSDTTRTRALGSGIGDGTRVYRRFVSFKRRSRYD